MLGVAGGGGAPSSNTLSTPKGRRPRLIGIHHDEGRIDLGLNLAQLGIDDRQGLTEREKLATVLDLLTARSGVYHPSGYESPWMLSIKPARGTAGPGTTWCYNNWDFNALGSIFRKLTQADIHHDFTQRLATPLGLEDFDASRDGALIELEASEHPAYPFRMTARDLARFGQLFLRHGAHEGQQLVPADWVAASVTPYSDAGTAGAS